MNKDDQAHPPDTARVRSSTLGWRGYVFFASVFVLLAVLFAELIDRPTPAITTTDDEQESAERISPALAAHEDAVWARVALVLRWLGHLTGSATPALSEVRTALKRYQHTIGVRETGVLNPALLKRLLDEPVALDPYVVRGAAEHGRWFFVAGPEVCQISAGASRIDGRTIGTERPAVRVSRNRQGEADERIEIGAGAMPLFADGVPVTLTAGETLLSLRSEAGRLAAVRASDGALLSEIERALGSREEEVQVRGSSVLDGALSLSFPTQGFEAAYRAMATTCGPGQ